MFQIRELEYFLAIVDAGSVSEAARRRWVSQPAVSKQLTGLERTLGTKLFRRGRSGMTLTPAGERMVPIARDLASRLRQAESLAKSWASGELSFRVACPATTGEDILRPFVASGAAIDDIMPCDPGEVYGKLQHGADLAVSTWDPPAHLRQRHLFSLPITAQSRSVMGPDADRLELSALVGEQLLVPGNGSAVGRTVFARGYGAGLQLTGSRMVSNGTIAQALASAGKGIALVCEPRREELSNQLLVHEGEPIMVRFSAAWEADHYAAAEIEVLVEEFSEWIGEHWEGIMNHPEAALRPG